MSVTYERLTEIIESAGYEAESYSGRGMYGKQCVSFSAEVRDMSALADLVERAEDTDEAADILRGMTTDRLGLGTVFYWRRVAWPSAAA